MKKRKKIQIRAATAKARQKVLKIAKRKGRITNAQARKAGGWKQPWYHLQAMAQAGQLKRVDQNDWRPKK